MKVPRIDESERKVWHRFLLKNAYVEGDGKGKLMLTMKGQEMLLILNELKSTGQVKHLDDRWVQKNGVTKLGELILELVWKRHGRNGFSIDYPLLW